MNGHLFAVLKYVDFNSTVINLFFAFCILVNIWFCQVALISG